jgi:hypothetical protein
MNLLDYKNETVQDIYFGAGVVLVCIIVASIFWYKNRKSVQPERSDSVVSYNTEKRVANEFWRKQIGEGKRRIRKKNLKNKK